MEVAEGKAAPVPPRSNSGSARVENPGRKRNDNLNDPLFSASRQRRRAPSRTQKRMRNALSTKKESSNAATLGEPLLRWTRRWTRLFRVR